MMGKSKPNRNPKPAGIDELDVATSETDVPVPYFAGFRRLDVSWIMPPVISRMTNASSAGKGKSGKSGDASKNYFGHCAGMLSQGPIDFFAGLLINNELVYPDALIWDSKIFKNKRTIIYTDGNAYQITVDTAQPPPGFPWTIIAFPYAAGSYAQNVQVVNAGMLFKSLHNANVAAPPGTPTSTADWSYLSTPDQWVTISGNHFWTAGSVVAWEGQVYQTPADTNAQPPGAPWVLFQILESASPNPLKMTVTKSTRFGQNAGPGDWYLYWGLPNQVLDVAGEQILNGLGHPPYRNCPVIVGKNIAFGTSTVNPPSVQVLAGRAPVQTLIVGASTQLDANWQANPWVILAEMLTHPVYGLGLPTTWFDAASWQAEADRCAANPSMFYIAPLYSSLKRVSEVVADLMGYPDAFIFWSTVATLMAGHWPHGEAAPAFNAANTINRDNTPNEFQSSSEGWGGTANSVAVSIQDVQAAFKSRPCIASNLFNMTVTKRVLSQKVERPWITRYAQGLAWATEFAKIAGDQTSSGVIEIQSEKATAVKPGAIFLMTDDVLQTSEVMRCTRRVISAPPTGKNKITFETERGVAPQPYSPTQTNPAPANGPAPALIQNFQAAQLPTSLAGVGNSITLLAGRENDVTSAIEFWFQQADATAYQSLGTLHAFAVAGSVLYNSGTLGELATANSAAGATYAYPTGSIAFGSAVSVYDALGNFLGHYTYGTDYTFDLVNQTITLTAGTTIPNGSQIFLGANQGALATALATPGNTYNIPKNFWGAVNVWTMAPGAAYVGGLTAATHCVEGTDYLIDPVAGTLTVINGGAIGANYKVFVFFLNILQVGFAANTPQTDIDSISAALTQDEINDNSLLLFAFKKANPSLFEIMGVTSIQAATSGTSLGAPAGYYVQLRRQQYGTLFGGDGVNDFGPNDIIFIIQRSQLPIFTHEAFQGLEESASTASFILAPQSAWVSADISDLYDSANNPSGLSNKFSYAFNNLFAPTVTWIQQLKAASGTLPSDGAVIASFAGSFLTTDTFLFSFQLNAGPGAKLISASLTGKVGEQQLTLWSQTFSPSLQQNLAVAFSLTVPGLWNLAVTARCDDESEISYPLTLVGSATPVQVQVNTPTTTYAPTPMINTYSTRRNILTGLNFGALPAGLTVLYQLQPRGTAYNPAGWSNAAVLSGGGTIYGTVPNFESGQKTLYAKSQQGGATDSPVASWNL